jgi:hypothetical protein
VKAEHLVGHLSRSSAEQFAAGAGAVGLPGQGQDLGVVDEPVDHGGGHDVV